MNRIYMGQIMAECDCPRQEACEVAQKCLAEKPQPITPEEVFMEAVWDTLKADTSDLGKQARILAAFRDAAIREAALREAAAICIDVSNDVWTQIGREHERWMKATAEDCSKMILALIGEPK